MNKGIVSTGSKEATQAGVDVLCAGGNAFDAAIASVFASMTSEFALTGVGGGGAMMCHVMGNKPILYDFFVDTPPLSDDKDLDFFGIDVDFGDSTQKFHIGKGSVAVPGTLLGLITVHQKHGLLPLSIVLEPAIELAKTGTSLSKEQAYVFKILDPIFSHSQEGKKIFYLNGELLKEGQIFKNPDFASFLERVSNEGSDFFYLNDGATLMVNFFSDGGLLTKSLLKNYYVAIREPVQTSFKGVDYYSNPAPSVGGTLIVFLLKILEKSKKAEIYFPELLNAMLITNLARSEICLDPNQEYQVNKLLEDEIFFNYLKKHVDVFPNHNSALERGCTTHVSVIDKDLNSASVTTTNGEGCGYILPGTGIMMNNMLGETDLNPLGFHAYKHSMRLPTMVSPSMIMQNDKPLLLLGSGGSNRIRSAIVQVIINFLIKGMNISDAINAPRMHLEGKDIFHEPGIEIDHGLLIDDFSIYPFEDKNLFFGGVNAVTRDGGCSDPRRGGSCQII